MFSGAIFYFIEKKKISIFYRAYNKQLQYLNEYYIRYKK